MNKRFIVLGTTLMLLSLSTVFAACSSIELSEETITLEKTGSIKAYVKNSCTKPEWYIVRSESAVATDFNIDRFSLYPGDTETLTLYFYPSTVLEGTYPLTEIVENQESLTATATIQVVDNGFIEWTLPEQTTVQEFDYTKVPLSLKNPTNRPISNIFVTIEEQGVKLAVSDSFSLGPHEQTLQQLVVHDIGAGEHTLKATAYSGEYSSSREFKVNVTGVDNRFVTTITVEQFKTKALKISYDVKNIASATQEQMFLTVDSAPNTWQVISPSAFDLASGEQKKVSMIVYYDELIDFTVALYKGNALAKEDEITITDVTAVTGLITLDDTADFALFAVLMVGLFVLYRGWHTHKNKKYPVKEFI